MFNKLGTNNNYYLDLYTFERTKIITILLRSTNQYFVVISSYIACMNITIIKKGIVTYFRVVNKMEKVRI